MRCKKKIGNSLTLLGQGKKTKYKFVEPSFKTLEVFDNPNTDCDYTVEFVTDEVTALCPVTSQPDFYYVEIQYIPDRFCIESKSLKLYLFSYRQYGAFIETFANKVLDDLVFVCKPRFMRVCLVMKPRGGIKMRVVIEYQDGVKVRR